MWENLSKETVLGEDWENGADPYEHLQRDHLSDKSRRKRTLSSFDFNAAVGVNRSFISDLANCTFIQRHENILFSGPTGVGKSHVANALGIEALKRNFRVISTSKLTVC